MPNIHNIPKPLKPAYITPDEPTMSAYTRHDGPAFDVEDNGTTHRALTVRINGKNWLAVPDLWNLRITHAAHLPSGTSTYDPDHFSGCVGCEFDQHPMSRGLKHRRHGLISQEAQDNCSTARRNEGRSCSTLFNNLNHLKDPSGAIYIRIQDFKRYMAVRTALRMGGDPRPSTNTTEETP